MTGSFASINGTATITVNGLSEIKQIYVGLSANNPFETMIDITHPEFPIFCGRGDNHTYDSFGFKGSTDAVSGNTFTWYWNNASTFYYIAYGK